METGVMLYVWYWHYNTGIPKAFYFWGHVFIAAVYFVILLFASFMYGGLKIGSFRMIELTLSQGFATLPGLSRSGSTIAAATFCGLDRKFAVKYSFILSIPAIIGAAVLELSDISSEAVTGRLIGIYAAGMIAAAVVGYLAIRFMLRIVQNRKLKYFSYYCFAVGVLSIIGQFVFM